MDNMRPIVRRTYGKSSSKQNQPASLHASTSTSSSDLQYLQRTPSSSTPSSSNTSHLRSSSPPSSSFLITPPTSPSSLQVLLSPSCKRRRHESVIAGENLQPRGDVLISSAKTPAQGTLRSFFVALPKKQPLQPSSVQPTASTSTSITSSSSTTFTSNRKVTASNKASSSHLTQLHLTHLPLLHTCQQCQMSYVRGGDDEGVHEKHHSRVVKGIPWDGLGKATTKSSKGRVDSKDSGWRVLAEDVDFGGIGKRKGRVVVCDGDWGGSKLDEILSTVDTVLSSPPLPTSILSQCKIFLFVTSSPPPLNNAKRPRLNPGDIVKPNSKSKQKERIVAVVVSQGIKWAMRVLREGEDLGQGRTVVDSGGGVVCDPRPMPTPLGIHRLFTIPSYRSLGLARILLTYSCSQTVYGCTFSPEKGQVAFSQPTQSGRAVMESWGKGQIRVFVDDESQL